MPENSGGVRRGSFDDYNKSTLFATQFPVAEWHGRFQDPTLADAVLDRIVHDSYRIELSGDSMRKRTSDLTKSAT